MTRAIDRYYQGLLRQLIEERGNVIERFNSYMGANSQAINTKLNYLKSLRSLYESVGDKDLKKVSKADMENWVNILNEKYSPGTANLYKRHVKKFYQWLFDMEEGYPDNVRWIKEKKSNGLPQNFLSPKDVAKLLKYTYNPRDRALIHVLYESAGRIEEVLNLKIKDINFDEYGASIILTGKTGSRRIRLINSVPDLQTWLNTHPTSDEPGAWLWATKNGGLAYPSFYKSLGILKKRAGIKKAITPHGFRHGRLTELAKEGFVESELRVFAGWTADSSMPATYLHISGADLDDKLLSKAGFKEKGAGVKPDESLKPVKCPRCGDSNPGTSKYCRCGTVLNLKEAYKMQDQNKALEDRIKSLEQLVDREKLKQEIMAEVIVELKAKD
jgi:site-specific recombinase XerD